MTPCRGLPCATVGIYSLRQSQQSKREVTPVDKVCSVIYRFTEAVGETGTGLESSTHAAPVKYLIYLIFLPYRDTV